MLREDIENLVKELRGDTLVSIREGAQNEGFAYQLEKILKDNK